MKTNILHTILAYLFLTVSTLYGQEKKDSNQLSEPSVENPGSPVYYHAGTMPYFDKCAHLSEASRKACTNKKILRDINANLKLPDEVIKMEIQGRVFAEFTVNQNGDVVNVKILHSAHPLLNAPVIKAIKKLEKFKPGIEKGKTVSIKFRIPVNVSLK